MTGTFPRPHIGFIDDATHAAPVVAMRVRIDHGRDRQALADVLLEKLPRRANHFRAHQGVEDDPTGLAADEGDVGQVKAAYLVDARDHLIETVVGGKSGLTKQRGMDAVEVVLLMQELKPFHVPSDVAGVGPDLQVLHGSDKPPSVLIEVPRVGKRQAGACLLEHIEGVLRGRFALGMEMSLQGRSWLRVRSACIQDQMIGYSESGSRSRKGLDELSSC